MGGRRDRGVEGIGAIVRDHQGNVVAAFYECITPTGDSNDTEFVACLASIKFCNNLRVYWPLNVVVVFETDSTNVVRWINSVAPQDDWYDSTTEAQGILNFFGWSVQWKDRQHNEVADWLARKGTLLEEGCVYEFLTGASDQGSISEPFVSRRRVEELLNDRVFIGRLERDGWNQSLQTRASD